MRVRAGQPLLPANLLRTLGVYLVAGVLAVPLAAGTVRKKHYRPRGAVTRAVTLFPASPETEERVKGEIDRAVSDMIQLEPASLLNNPYLVQAVYFHDGFLSSFATDRPGADPSLRISSYLCRQITPQWKARYLQMLRDVYADDVAELASAPQLAAPVPLPDAPAAGRYGRSRYAHQDALDLFVPEGTPVTAAARGVVVLAQNGWSERDAFSTSTAQGGNTVIVFDPASNRFYRYAHLETVLVNPGTLVEPGQPLGTVGHTGQHASQPGHGQHLHFEINQYNGTVVESLDSATLWELLRPAQYARND